MKKTCKNAEEFCLKEEERINTVLQELKELGKNDEQLVEGQLAKLYGLAKVHKGNITVRSVLSMQGSPYHKLAEKIT